MPGAPPSPNSSGTSLHGRSRVSKMANMRLKAVLTLGVWSQIKRKAGTISSYYQRKIQQGKAPYQAINAARNKILHLALAVVRTQQPYDPNYQNQLRSVILENTSLVLDFVHRNPCGFKPREMRDELRDRETRVEERGVTALCPPPTAYCLPPTAY
ncbi:transposase [Candidatus Pollutiaquabacter sp.]|uniref:transposase n=1 Tax=Candidatus Pollutiaquabacter sp. TaxID=3416354 RepID=UPI003CBA9F6B|nr:transposase [Bacteroidota bacterium]